MLKLLSNFFNMDKEDTVSEKNPLLRRISSSTKRPETPDLLKNLIKSPEHFDSSTTSSTSNISDAFEEIHKGGLFCTYPKLSKKLSKTDYDKLTFQKFTNKFRTAMSSSRKELEQINDDILNENIDDIIQILQSKCEDKPLPEEIREATERILKDEEYLNSSSSLGFDNVNYTMTKPVSESSYDVLSGVWKMLATNCEEGKFAITYPNYDAFSSSEKHWLQTEPLPWQVMNESRVKCERWLNEQCE